MESFVYIALIWYGIGAITVGISMYISECNITLGDICGGALVSFFGPVATLIALIMYLQEKSDMVIFKRSKE